MIVLLTVSCQTTGRVIKVDECSWVKPIILSKKEIPLLSQETKRQILTHNKTWKWKCDGGSTRQPE